MTSKNNQKGFTLVETLVCLLIFSIALTGIFGILSFNMKAASRIKDNFIASGLVQEGVEVARNLRDTDWHMGNPFGTSIPDGSYRLEWNSTSLIALGSNPFIKKDPTNGVYNYSTGTDTIFKRTVVINSVSGVEKKIVVQVSWDERGTPKSISAEEHLFNWR